MNTVEIKTLLHEGIENIDDKDLLLSIKDLVDEFHHLTTMCSDLLICGTDCNYCKRLYERTQLNGK